MRKRPALHGNKVGRETKVKRQGAGARAIFADVLGLPLLSLPRKKFQNHIAMLRNYQTILGLLQNSKREIEIQSVDLDYNGLTNLANEMRRLDRVATLVVGGNLTADMVNSLVLTSGDRFNIKFAQP